MRVLPWNRRASGLVVAKAAQPAKGEPLGMSVATSLNEVISSVRYIYDNGLQTKLVERFFQNEALLMRVLYPCSICTKIINERGLNIFAKGTFALLSMHP